MIIAIDFDGTIHDFKHVPPGKKLGPPTAGAVEAVERLVALGHQYIVFSVWADSLENKLTIAKWLLYFKFPAPFDTTNIKPREAAFFVDDRAIPFTGDWLDVVKKIKRGYN
jgi:hypothetical protein